MTGIAAEGAELRVELGDPEPFTGTSSRELLVAAALAARAGTGDPVDLALLSAAAHKEDLRHYQQLDFTPPAPDSRQSITRIRHLDTGAEELIARGALESILYLCRESEATRYRAELEAGLENLHGFRAVAVARGSGPQADGSEAWQFLGVIPLKLTRQRRRRRDEPGAFHYVQVWDWQLRVLHWTAVFAILLLCLSGWLIGSGPLTYGGTGNDPYFIGYLRLAHFSAGWLLMATGILRVAGLFFASTRYQRWQALFPVTPGQLRNLFRVMQNYLFCIFEHGPHYIGHNPLQQVAYTGIYLMAMVAVVSGLALYGLYDPSHWLFGRFLWVNHLLGAQFVRLVHLFMMWVFLAFLPIHVYLSIRADTVEREGAISSIFSGGRWCRKGTRFEDG
ncbi:MAG TPA: Ni/Fe-hydrogenase, b-type cytochrome subunit [Geobacteraceae bacterium]